MPFITINNDRAKNFINQTYRNNDDCIIFYYWNSCGHCHQFKPIFYDVIRELMDTRQEFMKEVPIFQVEYDDFDLLPDDYKEVQAFPSVVLYSNGKKKDEFNPPRTKSNLSNFILSSLGEPSLTYKSSSSRKKVIRKYPKSI